MTRHPIDTAALRAIKRCRADANMRLIEARKREHNGNGWEARASAEREIREYDKCIHAVETLPDD